MRAALVMLMCVAALCGCATRQARHTQDLVPRDGRGEPVIESSGDRSPARLHGRTGGTVPRDARGEPVLVPDAASADPAAGAPSSR